MESRDFRHKVDQCLSCCLIFLTTKLKSVPSSGVLSRVGLLEWLPISRAPHLASVRCVDIWLLCFLYLYFLAYNLNCTLMPFNVYMCKTSHILFGNKADNTCVAPCMVYKPL